MDIHTIDRLIYNDLTPLLYNLAIFTFYTLIILVIIRYLIHLIIREIRVHHTLKKGKKEGTVIDENLDEYSILLNLYVPDTTKEMNHLRIDRGLTEFNIEGEDGVNLGRKNYIVDIKQLPITQKEEDELERRKEEEFDKFLKNLSEREKLEIKDKLGDMVSEKELISYQELYLVFKGIEREYRRKMIERLSELEKNYLRLKGRIERSGVSETNSVIYMKRYRMLKREIEVYKMIIEHKSLLRKLIELDNALIRLENEQPFLRYGYTGNEYKTDKRKPIYRSDV